MSQRDYPSPETIPSSDCGDHDPSPDSSFGSLHEHTNEGQQEGKAEGKVGGKVEGKGRDEVEGKTATTTSETKNKKALDEQVLQALDIVKAKCEGRPLPVNHDGWLEIAPFTAAQYRRFHDELELEGLATFFETKIRHDYYPQRCILVFRMPSPVHDVFGHELLNQVNDWINRIRPTRDIFSPVLSAATSDITFQVPSHLLPCEVEGRKNVTAIHSPDGQFAYIGGYRYPPFILEIGYASKGKGKKAKNLAGLAKYYYEDIGIKTVLTVDLAYTTKAQRRQERKQQSQSGSSMAPRNTKQASFSLYRGPDCIISNRAFRDQAGEPVGGDGLSLHVSDFVPDAVLSNGDEHDLDQPEFTFQVTARELFEILAKAEVIQQDREKSASVPPEQPPKRKVTWALDDDSSDGNDASQDDDPEVGLGSTSKRRKMSDAAYSSSSRPSNTTLGVRTRSRTRASAGSTCTTHDESRDGNTT